MVGFFFFWDEREWSGDFGEKEEELDEILMRRKEERT